ncbi:OapA family protein [Thiolapillus sp.]|uniref:OapA family protein n=1 Tax=Thiolapillus sp. TaxID=2017437 RepID=UPI003AF77266
MQDYILNSRKQAARRRRQLLSRLSLLIIVVGGVAYLADHFLNFSGNNNSGDKQNGDLLPLPPVNDTLPAQSQNQPPGEPTKLEAKASEEKPAAEIPAPEAATASASTEKPQQQTEELPQALLTQSEPSSTPVTPTTENNFRKVEHTVGKGETLASIFKKQGLSPTLLHRIVTSSKEAKGLARIHPGQKLHFVFDENDTLQQLVLERSRISSLEIRRNDDSFGSREITRPVEKHYATATGIIESSLFVDGHKAGLTDAQIMELAQIFGWDIDFALELREGDQFHVIYEEQYLDGEKLRNGPILAAEFINRGNLYKAVRYTDKEGDTSYYDTEGNAKRRAFIRTPVKFSRISSRFTRKRWHPVLKRWRSHKGVDYAAPRGTPVKATGNGKVVFRGNKGGYGNVIFLRHGGKYTTVYGHLSRFAKGLKNGKAVKQGQIIGYVGSTGLATGPHLHYEFRVHGKHQNPLTIKLPKTIRLPKREQARFKKSTAPLMAQLDELRARTMVASAH